MSFQFNVAQRLCCVMAFLLPGSGLADDLRADSHAPIGVMGDHTHQAGEVMLSYRYMTMSMEGNGDGTANLTPATIATTVANRFFGRPGQPPTLRVVPTRMTMDMHMFGVMYAPIPRVTLMGMTSYVSKEMDHLTFAGGMGDAILGGFTTKSEGLGDSSLSALVNITKNATSALHATLGLSLPTGDRDKTDTILTPANTRPSPRLPYPMQLGSGTYDAIAGLTYSQHWDKWAGGAQWRSTVRLGDNDEGYRLGDRLQLTGWMSYQWRPSVSGSWRLTLIDQANIDGIDPMIVAPVQTADPDNQGFSRADASLGVNLAFSGGHRVALEAGIPFYQNLDGPQLETDWYLTLGYQFAR